MTIIDAKTKKIIEWNPIAFSTVDEKANPNVIWVAFVKVISDNKVLITDNYMHQTKNNIENNNNVCLAVWNKEWEGVKIKWTAEYITKGKWKEFVDNMPENRWLPKKWAIVITISQILTLS